MLGKTIIKYAAERNAAYQDIMLNVLITAIS